MNLSATTLINTIARQIDMERQRWIELFAGPGGMSEGLAMLGLQSHQAIGIEFEETACATAEAAGHRRILADVTTLDPETIALTYLNAPITGFHASPPCQGFSMAGKGKGREDTELILKMLSAVADGLLFIEEATASVRELANDDKSALTMEPLRWIYSLLPETVTLEQVPAVLPLWEAYAVVMRGWGYSVWTGFLQAEQFGVPQTRKRAFLIASLVIEVSAPVPTHSKYHNRTPDRLDEGVLPWVSMAQALGWGGFRVISNYGSGGDPSNRGERTSEQPSATITSKAGRNKIVPNLTAEEIAEAGGWGYVNRPAYTVSAGGTRGSHSGHEWGGLQTRKKMLADAESGDISVWIPKPDRELVRAEVEPRVNNQSGTEFDLSWPADRPAPTIAGRDLVTMPGANANRFNGSTKSRNDGIRVTAQEAGILQSFRADYPWQGTKGRQYQQVGNAVPPLLGAHVASAVLGVQACLTAVADAA